MRRYETCASKYILHGCESISWVIECAIASRHVHGKCILSSITPGHDETLHCTSFSEFIYLGGLWTKGKLNKKLVVVSNIYDDNSVQGIVSICRFRPTFVSIYIYLWVSTEILCQLLRNNNKINKILTICFNKANLNLSQRSHFSRLYCDQLAIIFSPIS